MKPTETIIRFAHASETPEAVSPTIGRITGLINAENFTKLMNVLDIDSNPRQPKETSITKEIFDTLDTNPEMFCFMSKGILVSATSCTSLDRQRYKLDFANIGYAQPGILDGGHNTFAIAKYLLSFVMDEQPHKKIKNWESLLQAWEGFNSSVLDLFSKDNEHGLPADSFQIPIELIYPRSANDENDLRSWGDSHRDITHARNNNLQLTDSTKDNHQGLYDYLKNPLCVPASISRRVEWKTNDGGQIKAADIVALSLIPLSILPQNILGQEINVVKIYNSKQHCVESFGDILKYEKNCTVEGLTYKLENNAIQSALQKVGDILDIYDLIYQRLPQAYNIADGSFGRIKSVKKKSCTSKFSEIECEYNYPDGFIIPLVVGIRTLLTYDEKSQELRWLTNPRDFIISNLDEIVKRYSTIIRFSNWDAQKIGKDRGSYEIAADAISAALNR